MITTYGLTERQLQQLCELFGHYPQLERVILYGSRAKGNFRPNSDVDITLMGKELTKTDLNNLDNEIDDLLLPYFFDISLFHKISNPDLTNHIERVGKVIYEREKMHPSPSRITEEQI